MAKTNKKAGNNNATKKTTSTYEQVPMPKIPEKASPLSSSSQQLSGSSQTTTGAGTLNRTAAAARSHTGFAPTRKQIEDRAREIWQQKRCPVGQDEQNWMEAEAQLKKEMGIK
jgi:cytochrome c-type biogenesis protein CcmH/NrfF